MTVGVEIRNDDGNILINRSYNNLYLSHKYKASDLPVSTISSADGSWIMGSFQARKIPMYDGEVLVAAGVSAGKPCPYMINYGLAGVSGSSVTPHPYLFAARKTFGRLQTSAIPVFWDNPKMIDDTGITDTSAVSDDLYVYVFARSANSAMSEKVGFQVFDENNQLIYDSTKKSMRILRFETESDEYERYYYPENKKIAIAPCGIGLLGTGILNSGFYVMGVGTCEETLVTSGEKVLVTCTGAIRMPAPSGTYSWTMANLAYIALDVTGY